MPVAPTRSLPSLTETPSCLLRLAKKYPQAILEPLIGFEPTITTYHSPSCRYVSNQGRFTNLASAISMSASSSITLCGTLWLKIKKPL